MAGRQTFSPSAGAAVAPSPESPGRTFHPWRRLPLELKMMVLREVLAAPCDGVVNFIGFGHDLDSTTRPQTAVLRADKEVAALGADVLYAGCRFVVWHLDPVRRPDGTEDAFMRMLREIGPANRRRLRHVQHWLSAPLQHPADEPGAATLQRLGGPPQWDAPALFFDLTPGNKRRLRMRDARTGKSRPLKQDNTQRLLQQLTPARLRSTLRWFKVVMATPPVPEKARKRSEPWVSAMQMWAESSMQRWRHDMARELAKSSLAKEPFARALMAASWTKLDPAADMAEDRGQSVLVMRTPPLRNGRYPRGASVGYTAKIGGRKLTVMKAGTRDGRDVYILPETPGFGRPKASS